MVSYRTSRVLPTILTIVIIVIVIVGLVSLARVLFSNSSSSGTTAQTDAARQALLDTTDGTSMTMSVRGPIVADENFRSYHITVTPSSRQFQALKGYQNTVLNQQDFSNNTTAYDQLVNALDKANFTSAKQLTDSQNDLRGICATGRVYEFTVSKNNSVEQALWTSTCSGSTGSLRANLTQVSQLFLNQIPNSTSLLNGFFS